MCSPGCRGHVAANARPMRGQCAARAGLPEELPSSFAAFEALQVHTRSSWSFLETPRAQKAPESGKETSREHFERQGDQQRTPGEPRRSGREHQERLEGQRRSRKANETSKEQQYLMAGFWIPTSVEFVWLASVFPGHLA